jgi:hypothetical protein
MSSALAKSPSGDTPKGEDEALRLLPWRTQGERNFRADASRVREAGDEPRPAHPRASRARALDAERLRATRASVEGFGVDSERSPEQAGLRCGCAAA